MSYDIRVFGRQRVELSAEFVAGSPGLALGARSNDSVQVLRGQWAAYSFTVDGPLEVEPEDVPSEVLTHVLEPRFQWNVLVEGSSAAEVPHARKFAKRLAVAVEGMAVDEQTGELLAKVGTRAMSAPAKGTRIRVLELSWYDLAESVPTDPVDDWLEVCGQLLPEAMPRRFGDYEPLQHRLDRDGPALLRQLARAGDVSFKAGKPCLEGSFTRSRGGSVWVTQVDVHESAVRDADWQAAVRRMFLAYAERRAAFLAVGEIVRRVGWNGRSTWYDERTERTVALSRANNPWVGLPPYPVWWTWYGEPYRELVEPNLDPAQTTVRPGGLFHQASPEPRRRGSLIDSLPAELRTSHGRPAVTIPSSLQRVT